MGLSGILLYCRRAFLFALPAGALWSAGYWLVHRKRPIPRGKFFCSRLLVCYLAALFQITVIRDWAGFFPLAPPRPLYTLQLIPLRTTLEEASRGLWPFLYHVAGNMAWFLPLGLLGPRAWKRLEGPVALLLCGAGLSLLIEALQWAFSTGVSDIDDLLLNACGALSGWAAGRMLFRKAP